jgi:hypothetical protein
VQRTLYWDLLHATGPRDDLMTLMYGKIGLLEPTASTAAKNAHHGFTRKPTADVFARLCAHFNGVTQVQRHAVADQPNQFVFSVERTDRPTLFVFWERRDLFDGESVPPTDFAWPWHSGDAHATDLFGNSVPVRVSGNALHLPLTIDPLFVEIS